MVLPRLEWLALVLSLAIGVTLAFSNSARSQTVFERLVMPGPLIEGHAKYEKTCNSCHEPFDRKSQKRLCLDCHKDVAADVLGKLGLHGRHPEVAKNECRHCHSEHKGRAFKSAALDRETFNHGLTDFALKGAHVRVACTACHTAAVKYRAAKGQCIDCHKSVEPHRGELGTRCEGCHSEETWKKTKPFDHAKTKFPLIGAHQKTACTACHGGEVYKNLATTCVSCHRIQDVHAGRHGEKCETCHASQKWAEVRFNHATATKFPLKGKHATVKCDACHTGNIYQVKLSVRCVDCHAKNDPHKGQLGKACATCHNETGWRKAVAFDHDITRFPLLGLHAAVPCESCHRTPSFKDAPRACAGCHQDKVHQGRLGTTCVRCHNPNGWALWRFDHAKEARYPLTGAHAGLSCHACHTAKTAAKVTAPTACIGCHKADDIHQGAFGSSCDQCHTTATFRQGSVRR